MGGGEDQKAQEKLASRSSCSFGAVGGATDQEDKVVGSCKKARRLEAAPKDKRNGGSTNRQVS